MKRKSPNSVDSDVLRRWKVLGAESPLLDARLRYMEIEGVARYVRMMEGVERVYPNMLPTQASGRWSTKGPPLVNFPPDCINPACPILEEHAATRTPECWSAREVVGPDPGWYWLHWDLDSIEARLAAADAGDQDDLEAFRANYDLHTITACRAYQHALPPVLTKACHDGPESEAWRQSWSPAWSGSEDRRRHIFKTVRYATAYCMNPKGVLQARDIEKLGLKPDELVRFATMYLRAKPQLMARKRQVWEECATTQVSYTWYGRRRRLYGDWNTRAKEGWSHRISGTVTDYMNQAIIAITNHFPECHLVLNLHDGATIAFPGDTHKDNTFVACRQVVEKNVTSPTGHTVPVTASWEWIDANLERHRAFSPTPTVAPIVQ